MWIKRKRDEWSSGGDEEEKEEDEEEGDDDDGSDTDDVGPCSLGTSKSDACESD